MKEEQNKSTLGLSDEDLKELGADSIEPEVPKKKKKEKTILLTEKQFNMVAISSLVLGIIVMIIGQLFCPSFNIDITEFSGFGTMLIIMVIFMLIQNLWLPLLFEVVVLLCKKKVGNFYRTWTIITLLLDIVGVVGLVLSVLV